jgi:hypothetical protein
MKLRVGGGEEGVIYEPGVYQAALTHISDVGLVRNKFKPEGLKPAIVLTFQIDKQFKSIDGTMKNYVHNEMCTPSLHPSANLFKYLTAMNVPMNDGEEFEIESAIGTRCELTLKKAKKDENDEKSEIFLEIDVIKLLPPSIPLMTIQPLPRPKHLVEKMKTSSGDALK